MLQEVSNLWESNLWETFLLLQGWLLSLFFQALLHLLFKSGFCSWKYAAGFNMIIVERLDPFIKFTNLIFFDFPPWKFLSSCSWILNKHKHIWIFMNWSEESVVLQPIQYTILKPFSIKVRWILWKKKSRKDRNI